MTGPDHYAVLGVDPGADRETIRRAYVAIARATHPDRASGDATARAAAARRIREVNAAWNVLGDPVRRAEYDRRRRGARAVEPGSTTTPRRTRVVVGSSPSPPPPAGASGALWVVVGLLLLGVAAVLVVSAYASAGDSRGPTTSTTTATPSVGACVDVSASSGGRIATVVPCDVASSGRIASIVDTPRPCPSGVAVELADGRTTLCLTAVD